MDVYRSEEVVLTQIFLESQTAYHYIKEFGELGVVHFIDLNEGQPLIHRKYLHSIYWCDELERKIDFLYEQLVKENRNPITFNIENISAPDPRSFVNLEENILVNEKRMRESLNNLETLKTSYNKLTEYRQLIGKVGELLGMNGQRDLLVNAGNNPDATLNLVTGTIATKDVWYLEQIIWRSTKGNVFFRYTDLGITLKDIETDDEIKKSAFLVFAQGENLLAKINKICSAMNATIFNYTSDDDARNNFVSGLNVRISDMESVLNQAQDHLYVLMMNIRENYGEWKVKVAKIKAIYSTLNLLSYDPTSLGLVAEAWIPSKELANLNETIRITMDKLGSEIPVVVTTVDSKVTPPTYFRTNKFLKAYQNIVDAYGVAKYQEANPALFSLMTFPFLFAIMFSDFGHGIMLTLIGLFLVCKEKMLMKYKENEMFGMIFNGRYLVLLMGIFSMYTGFIYNDTFSRGINLFGSMWIMPDANSKEYNISYLEKIAASRESFAIDLNPLIFARKNFPYDVGLDPIWSVSENLITVTNSFKMKLSIILGVVHMLMGMLLNLTNQLHFGHYLDVWTEFIPGMIFFLAIFGYLVFLIFYKWIMITAASPNQPSLLLTIIGMFLHFGAKIEPENKLFTGQENVQTFLAVISILCIPWMLIVKPVVLYMRNKKNSKPDKTKHEELHIPNANVNSSKENLNDSLVTIKPSLHHDDVLIDLHSGESFVVGHAAFAHRQTQKEEDEMPFSIGETIVLQSIHTIEFVLGSISNTASYLRLWALGLAHAQLSEVLWSMVIQAGLTGSSNTSGIILYILFIPFICLTFAILIIMEGLSAFLHALRLHWVEFQNKFYVGTGYAFEPFDLSRVLKKD